LQYLRFDDYRTRPCRELIARVQVADPKTIVDLGCGPGNSTTALADRWPASLVSGLDSSPEMIEAARAAAPNLQWQIADIRKWIDENPDMYDIVFSNAALHWIGDHPTSFGQLLRHVSPGGALAVQMPASIDAPPHRLMRELAASRKWREAFPGDGVREWHVLAPASYYDILTPHATWVDLWTTDYIHLMDDPDAIVEFYKGSGLRPFLDLLTTSGQRAEFIADYADLIRGAYPRQADGRVLFPFQRLFVIAYR
jgi:trans-aconitate 2-methyltransferase